MEQPGAVAARILVAEDDRTFRSLLERWCSRAGLDVVTCGDGASCLAALANDDIAAVCLDLGLPDGEGTQILERIRTLRPDVPVVVLTGERSVEVAVRAVQCGASDYLTKPTDRERVILTMRNAARSGQLARQVRALAWQGTSPVAGFVGGSPAVRDMLRLVELVAPTGADVLIVGETGTGKDVIARGLHQLGSPKSAPFVAVNCASLPDALVESELFGHERGSFTGAAQRYAGRFEQADGGTLFLDEIGELSLVAQAKLLRALQERAFFRVGGSAEVAVQFRVVAATNRELRIAVAAGQFREDLYFRLSAFEVRVPPLRDRDRDVLDIARHIVIRQCAKWGMPPLPLSTEAEATLLREPWPGNVRELENVLARAILLCDRNSIRAHDLQVSHRSEVALAAPSARRIEPRSRAVPPGLTLAEVQRMAILAAYERHAGDVAAAARELGIGRSTLYRRLAEFGVRDQ